MRLWKNVGNFLGIGIAALGLAGAAHADQTVKIGLVVGLSGPGADLGESIARGTDLYLSQHKDGLPKGVRIEILKRDDGSNPDRTKRLAQELVVRDKVKLLAGVTLSPQALTIASVATEAKMPTLMLNATTGMLTRKSPYFVRFSYANWQMAYTLGAYAAKHGIPSAYTMVADYAAGIDMEEGFKKGFEDNGGKIVGSDRTPMSTTDYLPAMSRIKAANPKALFIFTITGAPSIATMKAFRDSGLQGAGVQLLATSPNLPDQQIAEVGPAALGILNSSIYTATTPNPANKAFVQAYQKAYGATLPDAPAVAAWNAMDAVYALINKYGAGFTSQQAMDFLRNWKSDDTPAGPIAIDPQTRDIVHDVLMAKVQKVGDGYVNVPFDTVHGVKDQWKIANPEK